MTRPASTALRSSLGLGLFLFSGAAHAKVWVSWDADANFQRDSYECERENSYVSSRTDGTANTDDGEYSARFTSTDSLETDPFMYDACLRARGYFKVKSKDMPAFEAERARRNGTAQPQSTSRLSEPSDVIREELVSYVADRKGDGSWAVRAELLTFATPAAIADTADRNLFNMYIAACCDDRAKQRELRPLVPEGDWPRSGPPSDACMLAAAALSNSSGSVAIRGLALEQDRALAFAAFGCTYDPTHVSCDFVATWVRRGDGVKADPERALRLAEASCAAGRDQACQLAAAWSR